MKRLLLLPLLALASCTPVLQAVQSTKASITVQDNQLVFHNPGPETAEDVSVAVLGPSLVTGADCEQVSRGWACSLGDVAAGKDGVVTITGPANSYSASFYTKSSGNRPNYIQK